MNRLLLSLFVGFGIIFLGGCSFGSAERSGGGSLSPVETSEDAGDISEDITAQTGDTTKEFSIEE